MPLTPFLLPERLRDSLPPPAADGNRYIDIRCKGRWDGVVVVDGLSNCMGIYIGRKVQPWNLDPDEIETVRPASLLNRALAGTPVDLYHLILVSILIFSPCLIVAAHWYAPLSFVVIAVSGLSVVLLASANGFIFTKFPLLFLGTMQFFLAVVIAIKYLWLRH